MQKMDSRDPTLIIFIFSIIHIFLILRLIFKITEFFPTIYLIYFFQLFYFILVIISYAF